MNKSNIKATEQSSCHYVFHGLLNSNTCLVHVLLTNLESILFFLFTRDSALPAGPP